MGFPITKEFLVRFFVYLNSSYLLNFSVILSLLFLSCVTPKSQDSSPKITGGNLVSPDDPIARATVALVEKDRQNPQRWFVICSGTLVSRNLVITAAHCIDDEKNITIQFLGLGQERDKTHQGTGIKHADYGKPYNETFSFDLALVRLNQPAPSSMVPVPIAKKGEFQINDSVILAGYGVTSVLASPESDNNKGFLYQAQSKIVDVFSSSDRDVREDLENWGLITYSSPDTKAGGCIGDSGGPMFIKKSGQLKVIGASAGGDNRCNSTGKYTNLEFYWDWLIQHGYKDHTAASP
jgi:secreted trypsin-like serine protease